VKEVMGIKEKDFRGSGKTHELSDARAVISYLAVERYGIRGAEVARELGLGRSAVYRSVRRGREKVLKNPGFKNEFPD
jgi:transposase